MPFAFVVISNAIPAAVPVECYCGSAGLFVQGLANITEPLYTCEAIKTGIGLTYTPIMSILMRKNIGGAINTCRAVLSSLSVWFGSNQEGSIKLVLNGTLIKTGSIPQWIEVDPTSFILQNTDATGLTGGYNIMSFTSEQFIMKLIELGEKNIIMEKDDVLTIMAKSLAGTCQPNLSLTWIEEQ
jgi:hypothetical protein